MTEQYLPCNINYDCGGGASGSSITTYGVSYPAQQDVTPFPVSETSILESVARRGNVDSAQNLVQSYNLTRFEVLIVRDDQVVSTSADHVFPDLFALCDFINANVSGSGGTVDATVVLRAYDVVNPSIRLQKVFGRNTAFSKLRSRYWGTRVFVEDTGASFPGRNDGLAAVYQELFGPAFPVAPNAWTTSELACFWMPSNRRRFYWGTGTNFGLSVTGDTGRFMLSGGSAVPVPPSPAIPTGFSNGGRRAYVVFDKQGNYITTWGPTFAISSAFTAMQNGWSVLYAAGMEGASGERAVFLKPLGIDQVRTQYFDPSVYRLEAVGSFKNDTQRRIRVPAPQGAAEVERDLSAVYTIDEWFNVAFANLGKVSGTSLSPGKVGFQLRDLQTNTVSPICPAQVQWRFRRRGVPLGAIIVNDV